MLDEERGDSGLPGEEAQEAVAGKIDPLAETGAGAGCVTTFDWATFASSILWSSEIETAVGVGVAFQGDLADFDESPWSLPELDASDSLLGDAELALDVDEGAVEAEAEVTAESVF